MISSRQLFSYFVLKYDSGYELGATHAVTRRKTCYEVTQGMS